MSKLTIGTVYSFEYGGGLCYARIESFGPAKPDSKNLSRVIYRIRISTKGPFRKELLECSKTQFRRIAEANA